MWNPWYIAALISLILGIILIIAAFVWQSTMNSGLPTGNPTPQGPMWLGIAGLFLLFFAFVFFAIGFTERKVIPVSEWTE